jgi:Sec-independent protein translocase protein TatA
MIDFSPIQIIMVLAIALIAIGPRRLPELARSVGKGVREMRGQVTGIFDETVSAPRTTATSGSAEPADEDFPVVDDELDPRRRDEDDDVLEGVVVSGTDQPARRAGEAA